VESLTLPLNTQPQCFLINVQLLWSRDCRKYVIFLQKNCILQWNIFNFVGAGVTVENCWTKLPKATPLLLLLGRGHISGFRVDLSGLNNTPAV